MNETDIPDVWVRADTVLIASTSLRTTLDIDDAIKFRNNLDTAIERAKANHLDALRNRVAAIEAHAHA